MRTKSSTTTAKVCFIVRRYQVKRTGSICAIIQNEDGVQYTACLHSNGRTSCTCPARGLCYHIRHLHAKEYERNNHIEQEVSTHAQDVEQNNSVETVEKASVSAQTSKDSSTVSQARPTVIVARQVEVTSAEKSLAMFGLMRGQRVGGTLASVGSR